MRTQYRQPYKNTVYYVNKKTKSYAPSVYLTIGHNSTIVQYTIVKTSFASHCCMILILDGNSEMSTHVWSDLGYFTK